MRSLSIRRSGDRSFCRVPAAVLVWCLVMPATVLSQGEKQRESSRRPGDPVPAPGLSALAQQNTQRIYEALNQPVTANFEETPLSEALRVLVRAPGVNVWIDERGFAEEGLDPKQSVNLRLQHAVTLRSALRLLLEPLNLTFSVEDEVLKITSKAKAGAELELRVYPINDLLPAGPAGRVRLYLDDWVDLIQETIDPASWQDAGGQGTVVAQEPQRTLVISQTRDIHEQVARLLQLLRSKALADKITSLPPAAIDSAALARQEEARDRIRRKLAEPVEVYFDKRPLKEAVQFLRSVVGANVVLDMNALQEEGIAAETPVTVQARQLPLESILRRMLRQAGLTYVLDDEVILITSKTKAANLLETQVYFIEDLWPNGPNGRPAEDAPELLEMIENTVEPDSWQDSGGAGTIAAFPPKRALVVYQSQPVHDQLAGLLAQLRGRPKN